MVLGMNANDKTAAVDMLAAPAMDVARKMVPNVESI
jgi:hypothetical protein